MLRLLERPAMPDHTTSAHHLLKRAVRADDSRLESASRVASHQPRGRAVAAHSFPTVSSSEAGPNGASVRAAGATAVGHPVERPHSDRMPSEGEHADDVIYLTLDMPLSVRRLKAPAGAGEASGSSEDLCAEWDRMRWKDYESIADGLRKVVTGHLGLPCDAVSVDKSVNLIDDIAVPRVILRLKKEHKGRLNDPRLQVAIQSYHRLLKGQSVEGISVENPNSGQLDLADESATALTDTPDNSSSKASIEKIADIARDVSTIVGSRTLPVPCIVDSPAWPSMENGRKGLQLSGRLAEAPVREIPKSEPIPDKCTIDGFRMSTHSVYLVLLNSKDGKPINVGFEESKLLDKIRRYASLSNQIFNVTLVLSGNEANPRRTLEAIEPADDEDFALN